MRKLSLLGSLVATAAGLTAQCAAPGAPHSLATANPFAATHYLGSPATPVVPDPGYAICSNWIVSGSINISQIDCYLYDDGVNPVQVGNTGPCDVWICPTTYIGNELTPPAGVGTVPGTPVGAGPWVLAGSGVVTVADSNNHSPIVMTSPISLSAGTYGVMIQVGVTTAGPNPLGRLHPLLTIPAPAAPSSDPVINISTTNHQRVTFTSGLGAAQGINIQVYYTLAPNSGEYTEYGAGCYFRPQSFYEIFPAGAGVDVTPGALQLSFLGANYLVSSSVATYTAPTSGQINIPGAVAPTPGPFTAASSTGPGTATEWDDCLSIAMALPASWGAGFPYPGGSTTQIQVSSNGHVFLQPSVETFGFYGDIARFLNDSPRLCMMWGDLDGSAAGASINVETAPADAYVQVSWHNVPEWAAVPTGNPFRMQLRMYPSGQVEYIYNNAVSWVAGGAEAICGFSYGGGSANPGNRDLSATMPFQSGDGSAPAHLTMTARPVIGTTPFIRTENIPAGVTFNLLILSFTSQVPAFPLGIFGMPDCFQHIGLPTASTIGALFPGAAHNAALAIPNDPSYNGLQVFGQAAQIGTVLNVAGILASNGICIRVGLF
jgi:hypothetical protein